MGWQQQIATDMTVSMLNYITHGSPTDRPALVIVHGLFGSARNWGVIARRLADERQVIAVDMRNHGHSPRQAPHDYPEMAGDLAEVINQIGGPVDLIGHSMGGKAAMMLALHHPQHLHRLLVADIAPVAYSHSQMSFVDAMRAVDLNQVAKRADAQAQLASQGVSHALQGFFTQSLDIANKRWLLNLDQLAQDMPAIMGFPPIAASWDGPALFLTGENSDYVTAAHRAPIRDLFPAARFVKLRDAGHWLHAEQPRAFEAAARAFFNA